MPRLAFLVLLPVLVLASACGDPTEAPAEELTSVDAVTDAMLARYTDNLGDVESFTVVGGGAEARYTVSGADTTGLDRFDPPQVTPVGDAAPESEAQLLFVQVPNVPRLARGLQTADLAGPLTRDGRRAYVLTTTDPGALFGEPGLSTPDTTETREFRVYVDADRFDVLEIYQLVASDTLRAPVTSRIIYSDFQETGGVTLPHTVRQIQTGLNLTIPDDERMLMGGQLGIAMEQLRRQPASPERDARVAHIEAQQRMIGEGLSEATLTVESVRVGAEE